MAFEQEKRAARRLLAAFEAGPLNASETSGWIDEADPTLVYLVFSWIRASYPASHPAADAVLGRLSELCTRYPRAARIAQEGSEDSLVEWFEDAYSYRDFRSDEFIELIVEKMEG